MILLDPGLTYHFTETWNNAPTAFDGLSFDATDTASAAGSNLLRLGVGGVDKFAVRKDSQVRYGLDASNHWTHLVSATGDLAMTGEGATGGAFTLTPKAGKNITFVLSGAAAIFGDGASASSQPAVTVTKALTGSGNAHAFVDESSLNKSGTPAYNSFDADPTINGTNNYDHVAAFQARPSYRSAGTIARLTGFQSLVDHQGGLAARVTSFEARDHTGAGTSTDQYGLYIEALTKGDNNHGIHFLNNPNAGSITTATGIDLTIMSRRVGIGVLDPATRIEMEEDVNSDSLLRIGNPNAGTAARSGLSITNDSGGSTFNHYLTGKGYTGQAGWQDSAVFAASTNVSGGMRFNARNGGIRFETGGFGSGVERVVIDNTGIGVGLGAAGAPLAKGHFVQASTTAAIPVLRLSQADLSEELIRVESTIGVGNPIEAVGAKVFTATHYVRCHIEGVGAGYVQFGTIA